VLLEDGSAYAHPGTLEFTGTSVDTGTGNVTLRAVIPNPDHLLLPGMYLRAVLPLADDDQAILVPQQAVTRDAKGEPEVKLLGPGDTVVERRIATGDVVGHDWRVTAAQARRAPAGGERQQRRSRRQGAALSGDRSPARPVAAAGND
jgi:multidrug efflux system membrane fusion protein